MSDPLNEIKTSLAIPDTPPVIKADAKFPQWSEAATRFACGVVLNEALRNDDGTFIAMPLAFVFDVKTKCFIFLRNSRKMVLAIADIQRIIGQYEHQTYLLADNQVRLLTPGLNIDKETSTMVTIHCQKRSGCFKKKPVHTKLIEKQVPRRYFIFKSVEDREAFITIIRRTLQKMICDVWLDGLFEGPSASVWKELPYPDVKTDPFGQGMDRFFKAPTEAFRPHRNSIAEQTVIHKTMEADEAKAQDEAQAQQTLD